ncbi:MAG: pyruvate kinase [Proteobacteria bacterium]|jgi:pyruvate kinase|nr:pyruvate kinase [Pseudomonadota bacterium]
MNVNLQAGDLRRTKIVATLGPATDDDDVFRKMLKHGLDVVRVNFSHGSAQDHLDRIERVRRLSRETGQYVGILVDLQGPKIRIGKFKEGKVTLREADEFVLDAGLGIDLGDQHYVGITYPPLADDVNAGDRLLLDDGLIELMVTSTKGSKVTCKVTIGGVLSNSKGLNLAGGGLSAAALTDKDKADILTAAKAGADYLAISFVTSAADVELARKLFREAGGQGFIVSKIERAEAVDKHAEIIDASDVVMIARGDLAVEIGDAELPAIQKILINAARERNCVCITATQMMQSMVDSPIPTRAEVLDVANAVMDGTDAVMLSAETAVGSHPDKVIEAMARICLGAERHRLTRTSRHRVDEPLNDVEESIAMGAMYIANHLGVRAILALTESGQTAKLMSRISSGIPIMALSRNAATVHRVTLYRGVYPVLWDIDRNSDVAPPFQALEVLKGLLDLNSGDSVLITFGDLEGVEGNTNMLKIVTIS